MSDESPIIQTPDIILEDVIDYLDFKSKICLRKTCTKLRRITDTRKMHFIRISVEFRSEEITIRAFENNRFCLTVRYQHHSEGCLVKIGSREKLLKNTNFLHCAFLDLKMYIANPRVSIDSLEVENRDYSRVCFEVKTMIKEMITILESFNHQLSVENIIIHHDEMEHVTGILRTLKPGVLKRILLSQHLNGNCSSIFETEQWKNAISVTIFNDGLPVETFFPFQKAWFLCQNFSLDNLKKFIEIASQPPHDVVYGFRIKDFTPTADIVDYLKQFPNLCEYMQRGPFLSLHHTKIPTSSSTSKHTHVQITRCKKSMEIRTVTADNLVSSFPEYL